MNTNVSENHESTPVKFVRFWGFGVIFVIMSAIVISLLYCGNALFGRLLLLIMSNPTAFVTVVAIAYIAWVIKYGKELEL